MTPGATIIGLDQGGHLWIILSAPLDGGMAVANLTTHTESCFDDSCHLDVGDHTFVVRRSCVYYRGAFLANAEYLQRAFDEGTFPVREPLSASVLLRVQEGAIRSRFTSKEVKRAIEVTLGRE